MKPLALLAIGMAFSVSIFAQPVWESHTIINGDNTSPSIARPSGVEAGDLLVVAFILEKGSGVNISGGLTGWNQILITNNGSDFGMHSYYKIAGSSEPANYSFTLSTSGKWIVTMSRISGADPLSPIITSAGGAGKSTTLTAPSISIPVNNALILNYFNLKKPATFTLAPELGLDVKYSASIPAVSLSGILATFNQNVAGSTGDKTITANQEESWVAQQIAIRFDPLLPIELLDFAAVQEGRSKVRLSWTTATEKDNNYFSIARSADGRHWETFTEVKGAGDSHTLQEYSAIDDAPHPGINYYRLCQTDYDGSSECPRIVSITMPSDPQNDPVLFPNPANNRVVLSGFDTNAPLRVFNTAGTEVAAPLSRWDEQIELDVSRLAPGLYYVKSGTSSHILYKR